MNQGHLSYLASPEWAQALRLDLLPWLESVVVLGDKVLEVGPGPGLTTDILRERVGHVTAIEIDPVLAAALQQRLAGSNVEVISGDATLVALPANHFSAATCFSMLHHMPSVAAQDELFAALFRAVLPGGALVGVDSRDVDRIREAHVDDIFVPLDEGTLQARLEDAGFSGVRIESAGEYQIRFYAAKPKQN